MLQQGLSVAQKQQELRAKKEKELVAQETRSQELGKQLSQKENESTTLKKEIDKTAQMITESGIVKKKIYVENLEGMIDVTKRIKELVTESASKQQKIKQLKVDETRIKNLYHIFSKELMYVVLEDTLPVLFDIINAYLAQVVEYTIHFELVKSASDKLELEVKVIDEK